MNQPLPKESLDRVLREMGIEDISRTTIRQCAMIGAALEQEADEPFSHLEFGVPGIPACPIGIEAQKKALDEGKCSIYPSVQGLQELKENASRFVKAFIGIDINPTGCVPTVGSMQGTFASFLVCSQRVKGKDTVLFIDPGFPVQKMQLQVQGVSYETFDVYDYRGERLGPKLESYLEKGNICAIIYSNPNNPSWYVSRRTSCAPLARWPLSTILLSSKTWPTSPWTSVRI